MNSLIKFPNLSSFPIFISTISTSFLLFQVVINDSGIVCVLLSVYLILSCSSKILSFSWIAFTITCGVSICELRVIYDVFPKIFLQMSNGLIFVVCHIFLLHCGVLLFLEFAIIRMKKGERMMWGDMGVIMFVSYPVIVAAAWACCCSLLAGLEFVPFVYATVLYLCNQAVLRLPVSRSSRPAIINTKPEISIAILTCQFASGVILHGLIMVYRIAFTPTKADMRQLLIDNFAQWALAGLFSTTLPSTAVLITNRVSSKRAIRLLQMGSATLIVLLVVPLLMVHGVHIHTIRLMFMKVLILGLCAVLVAWRPQKMAAVLLAQSVAAFILLWQHLPWGIEILPRATFLLERTYFGIVLISGCSLICVRSITLQRPGWLFDAAFCFMISTFHVVEWGLYSAGLCPAVAMVVSGAAVAAVTVCCGWSLCMPIRTLIDGQILFKAATIMLNVSLSGERMMVSWVAQLATVTLGTLLSLSARSGANTSLWWRFAIQLSLFVVVLLIREPYLVTFLMMVMGEKFLKRPSNSNCLVLALVLDFSVRCKSARGTERLLRLAAILGVAGLLMNTFLPMSIVLLASSFAIHVHQKWIVSNVLVCSVLMSAGVSLVVVALYGFVLPDTPLQFLCVLATYALKRAVDQPNIRIMRRYFMRLWCVGVAVWITAVIAGTNFWLRCSIGVGFPLIVCIIVFLRARELADMLDTTQQHPIGAYLRVLARVQIVSQLMVLVGGFIAVRFQLHWPLIWMLPTCFLIPLPSGSSGYCSCVKAQMAIGRRINRLSLTVSCIGLLLAASVCQQSPVFATSLTSAGELSLQLDLPLLVRGWFEMVLCLLIGVCHCIMLYTCLIVNGPHECCADTDLSHIDCLLLLYTATIPLSLFIVFCYTSLSSVVLAFMSLAYGCSVLIL